MPFLMTPMAPTTIGITTVLICYMQAISISGSLYLDSFSDTLMEVFIRLYGHFNNTLRAESPSIFLAKSGRFSSSQLI